MALDPKDLEELKKLSIELGMNFTDIVDQLNKGTMSLKQFDTYMTGLRAQARAYNTELDYTVSSYTQILNQLGKQNQGLKLANSSISSLSDIARKVLNSQQGLVDLSVKELNSLKSKTQQKIVDLQLSKQIAEEEKANPAIIDKITQAIKQATQAHGSLLNAIDQETIRIEKQNEILGLTGASIKGLSTLFDKLGLGALSNVLGLDNAFKNAQEKARELSFDMTDVGKTKLNNEIKNLNDDLTESNQKLINYTNYLNKSKDPAKIAKWQKAIEDEKIKQDEINKQLDEKNKRLSLVNQNGSLFSAKLDIFKGALRDIGASFIKNMTDPMVLATLLVTKFVDALISVDKGAGDLAKSFGTSYEQAFNIRGELNTIANLSNDININTERLQKSLLAINQAFGTNTMLSGTLLKDFTQMVEVQGYSNEAAIGLTKISTLTGNEVNKIQKEILGQAVAFNKNNKLALNEKEILEAVAKTSDRLKISLGLGSKQLTNAVGEAKKLGLTLDEVAKIGDSLLQFESSIAAELEAELLIGKQINLEKARYYALTNDAAGLARELSREIGTSADFGKMNRIQQEALAKSLGMNADQLATTLVTQEALQKIGAKDEEAARKKFDTLVKLYGYEEAVKRIGDEKYGQQLKSQSIQERFNASVLKLQEVFVSLAEPVLKIVSPFMDLVTTILPLVNIALMPILWIFKQIGEAIQGFTSLIQGDLKDGIGGFAQIAQSIAVVWTGIVLGAKLLGKETLKNITLQGTLGNLLKADFWKSIGASIAKMWGSIIGFLGPFGIPVAIAAGAGLIGLASSLFSKAGDINSPATGKTVVSTKEGGLFELSPNDDLVAAPGISNALSQPKKETPNINASMDINPLLEAINRLEAAINNRPIMVETKIELDGQQISYNQSTGTNSFRS